MMEIWQDTANLQTISKGAELGLCDGVTTNPTIASSSTIALEKLIDSVLEIQESPMAVQVVADNTEDMVDQAESLYEYSNRLIIKIPVTQDGIRAIQILSEQGIPTLATAIFEPRQALLAYKAGALYLAPYVSKIEESGKDPFEASQLCCRSNARIVFTGKSWQQA